MASPSQATPAPAGPSSGLSTQRIAPGRFPESFTRHLIELQRGGFLLRLHDRRTDLWKLDPAHQAIAANRVGWLDALPFIAAHAAHLTAWARDARNHFDGFALLGMGGSSLAPEVIARVAASPREAARFTMLDSTDPDAIAGLATRLEGSRTLFLVSSKSGHTIETRAHAEFFWSQTAQRPPGQAFAAITDPGSPLALLAGERRFRHVFLNAPDIAGRYAALSLVGLVPAALVGVDLQAIAGRTRAMVHACAPSALTYENPGLMLGVLMGVAALNGADKLTLLTSPSLQPFAAWIEQLLAESTGKDGTGIIPIVGEPLDRMHLGNDRCVVALTLEDEPTPALEAVLSLLRNSGTPLAEISLPDRMAVFGEFYKWEMATVVAASLLRVDPFDEPNVQESKDMTAAMLQRARDTGSEPVTPSVETERLTLWIDPPAADATIGANLQAFFARIKPPMYLALLGFLNPGSTVETAIARLRRLIGPRLGVPTLFGYGPRYLHSTGQLHKGGPPIGTFIMLTSDHATDFPIPGAAYTFGQLEIAQALGDFAALTNHARPVLRIHLKGDLATAFAELEQAITAGLADR